MTFSRTLSGNSSDNLLLGNSTAELLLGRAGNDRLDSRGGNDQLLGGRNDDQLFGGAGNDVLSGDDTATLGDGTEKGDDILVGGSGEDTLYGWGTDILVGGSNNALSAALITRLKNDPFSPPLVGDGAWDTFIADNKQGLGYTLTVADYEVGIDRIDLRAFGVTSAAQFVEIQDKGGWFEAKTPVVGGAELVLRINANPTLLTYEGAVAPPPNPGPGVITGNTGDNNLLGTSANETLQGLGGNDRLEGLGGSDQLLGGKNDDLLFGGVGNDILSGDDTLALGDATEKGDDILVGGSGQDTLYGWGSDILVGGSNNAFSAALITRLNNDPFSPPLVGDGVRDTFIAVNKQGLGYTLTVADYEVGIDRINLQAFGVTSAAQFVDIQDKGGWFEAKTPLVGGAELVLRINANPNQLTYL